MGCANSTQAEEVLVRRQGGVETGSIATTVSYDENGASTEHARESTLELAFQAKRRGDVFLASLETDKNGQKLPRMKSIKIPKIKKSAKVKKLLSESLKNNILFGDLTNEQRKMMVDAMKQEEVKQMTTLIKEGEDGDTFYVVESGSFKYMRENGDVIGQAGKGDSFGELGMLFNSPRAVSVISTEDSVLWSLNRAIYRQIVSGSDYKKEKEIKEALMKVPLLKDLDEEQIDKLVDAVQLVKFKPGDTIIRKGDVGNVFYIVKSGSVRCTRVGSGTMADLIFGPGDYFGERALLMDEPRAANVIALEEMECLALDRESFDTLLGPLRELLDHNLGMRVLKSVPILTQLSDRERERVLDAFELETFKDGDYIIRQGEQGDKFYVIREGQAEVVKRVGPQDSTKVTTLSNGDYFGEGALLNDKPRDADIVARGDTQCFSLQRRAFERMLGPLEEIMKRNLDKRQEEMEAAVANHTKQLESNIKITDLKILCTLGTGTFGRVKLVEHKTLKKTYALKILQKAQIVAYRQQINVMNEKNVMMECDHPFILKLYQTFKDKHCLYMLLELIQGGELFTLLHVHGGTLSGNDARFYTGCVVDALEYLHEKTIIYRDLKPENLMIDEKGYIRVVDFGFAKKVSHKTYTLCGTPEYLAPELVLGKGHNKGVDYWAVGILVYEMIHGSSPFADHVNNDHMKICKNIVRGRLEFPKKFPEKPKDLIISLLVREPHLRLGMLKNGAADIKNHAWFKGFKWDQLLKKKHKAPWIPDIKSPTDTQNFEPYDEDDYIEPYRDDGTRWDADF